MSHMCFLTLSIGMFRCLELVAYSRHLFPLLYNSISFTMKKQKIRSGKELHRLTEVVMSPLNRAQILDSILSKVWIYHGLRNLSSLLRVYSFDWLFFQSLWRVFLCLLHHKLLALDQVSRKHWSCLTIFGTSIGWSKMERQGEADIVGSLPFCELFWILGFM
jgi:hypothetical protein